MKTVILQEKLKQGLQLVDRISSKSLTYPLLSTTLIKTQKNFLNLTSTDLELGISWWSLAKIEKEGKLAVPTTLFLDFLNFLPNKPTTISIKNTQLIVECNNHKTQIKGFPPDDFPLMPSISKENYLELESDILCQALEQVVDIPAFSQTRPEITGIFFSLYKNIIKVAATDSFRLGEKTIFLAQENNFLHETQDSASFIIPQKTSKEIINIFGQKRGRIRIYFSPNQIMLERKMEETDYPEVSLISRLIEGEYPAYQEIIPKKHDTQIILPRKEFLNHLKAAALFAGKINEVKLKIDQQKARAYFFSQNPDSGEYSSFFPAKIKGSSADITFNHRFLSSGLTNTKSAEVIFELSKNEGPALLKPLGDNSYLYVVMPIKAS